MSRQGFFMSTVRGVLGGCSNPSITGLLDLYPGASVAFSFRKLRNDYSGPCARLGGDNISNFIDVGFCNNYIDKEAIILAQETYGVGSPKYVQFQKFNDQSLFSNNLIRSSSNAVASELGGNPIALSSPEVTLSYNSGAMNFELSEPQLISVFAVYRAVSYGAITYILYKSSGGNNGVFIGGSAGGVNGFGVAKSGAPSGIMVQGTTEGTARKLGAFLGSTTSKKIYVNSVLEATATSALENPFVTSLTNNGAGSFRLQELIIYPNDQEANLAGIQSNINSYYGIY